MSDHQESLKQVVARIEASFVKIKQYGEKVDQFRISAGKQLVELQARIEAGEAGKGVKWWTWYAENFKNRTRRDARKVMALARADDPEAAAAEERDQNRKAVAAHRRRAADAEVAAEEGSYSKTGGTHGWTEEDFAAQIVRDVEAEVANLEDQVADIDLLRELVLRDLTFSFGRAEESVDAPPPAAVEAGAPVEPIETANLDVDATTEDRKAKMAALDEASAASAQPETPKRGRGRPPGSKNKMKAPEEQPTA
jgi:hypothetical protein